MRTERLSRWAGLIAPIYVAAWCAVAEAQPATQPPDGGRFDRCSTASDAVLQLARQSHYSGSEGFDTRACPRRAAADAPQESAASAGAGRPLWVQGEVGLAAYTDNGSGGFSFPTFSPTMFLSAGDRLRRFRIDASYTADVVTSASPDIVATASPKFTDARHMGTLAGEARLGLVRVGVDGGFSIEGGDYLGRTVGASVSADLHDQRITPMLAYHLGFDILGRSGTPFQVFHHDIFAHTIDAGASVAVEPSTIIVFSGTLSVEPSDTSKPYRYIPLFDRPIEKISPGLSVEDVEQYRLPLTPYEQLPMSRKRFAVLGRITHRFEAATLRVDERIYLDTWGLRASTTDARSWHRVAGPLWLGPHVRVHVQEGADFWRRAYVGKFMAGSVLIPALRTDDLDLSPYLSVTAGGGLRWELSRFLTFDLRAEGIYQRFFDALLVSDQWGFSSTATFALRTE